MEEIARRQEAIARSEAQRQALLAETQAAAKAELARRRAADAQEKKEAERRRALLVATQKRAAEEARIKKEIEERKKREAELEESEIPDLATATSAARAMMNGSYKKVGQKSTASVNAGSAARKNQGDTSPAPSSERSGMMATFNSVVAKTARKKVASDTSLLTREEKRNRKLAASLGVRKAPSMSRSTSVSSVRSSGGGPASRSHSPAHSTSSAGGQGGSRSASLGGTSVNAAARAIAAAGKAPPLPSFNRKANILSADKAFTETITLGQKKRDMRSIDEVERDLRAAREARLLQEGGGANHALEERRKREEEHRRQEEKRKQAMAEKKRQDLEAQGIFVDPVPPASESSNDARDPRTASNEMRRERSQSQQSQAARSRTRSPPVNAKLRAAAEFHYRKVEQPRRSLPGGRSEREKHPGSKGKSRGRRSEPDASSDDGRDPNRPLGKGPDSAVKATPKRETARDRFIREEAERKRLAAERGESGSRNGPGTSAGDRKGKRKAGYGADDGYDDEEDDDADSFIVDDEDEEMLDEDEDDDSDDGEDNRYNARKRLKSSHGSSASRSSRVSPPHKSRSKTVSEEIWSIFGRGRGRPSFEDEEMYSDEDDMEATAADIAREEFRSAQIARKEDENEQEAEERHAKEKAARLRKAAATARRGTGSSR
ncbi:hypothetical protein OC846_004774 [Tilletia horrida]|uniref:Uncharacterized protein n=1 Tax=Tilletia horrida TaxID=155126 RepID=A0AAN6GMN8_9BASI|nr:hypothetical protein OC845_005020 [Tilletia horrida]KAK0547634.1 hypothetical protein OC846_004774 [Tilletia horrida]KAK0562676.1 hypothetical protein OC861_005200 [Tilletia horrida]